MARGPRIIANLLRWGIVTAAMALIFLIPTVHFSLERNFIAGILATVSEFDAQEIMEKVIARNPELWRYEEARLAGLLRQETLGIPVRQAVYASDGDLVIGIGRYPTPPSLSTRIPLRDAGVVVGSLETSASLEPALRTSFVIASLLAVTGTFLIVLFEFIPLRRLRKAESAVQYMAEHDPLTGLLNRYVAESRFDQEMKRADRYGFQLALILFDIDHFKHINDTFGHTKGDDVLRRLTKAAEGHIRSTDALVRWGGEEFLIISPHTDPAMALTQAEKLRRLIEREDFGLGERVTISLGVCACEPGSSLQSNIERVDAALYRAKCAGRNRSEEADTAAERQKSL
ncbi:GGDEF domain-containing protein [Thiorhodococcus fuscus]|uniref:diguanylate cyclase n=1 Tax=Thiorhodococcus fuscus TaxID=527200 RepID=A0ABW4Y6F6_9GAMM